MAAQRWVLFLEDRRLAVARVHRSDVEMFDARSEEPAIKENVVAVAETFQRLLSEERYEGEPVLLALGSSFCACATVTVPSQRQARKRSAIGFLAEPHLPWSVEEAVIDYEIVGKDRASVTSAELKPLAELIATLEERSIPVASVAPAARLALEQHLKDASAFATRYALLWRNEESVDLWLIDRDRPTVWNWLPCDEAAIGRALGHLVLSEESIALLASRNVAKELVSSVAPQTGLELRELPPLASEDPLCAAARQGAAILDGRRAAPIELRRDQLAARDRMRSIRPQVRLLQGSVLLFFAAVGIALYGQCQHIDALRAGYEVQQRAVFEKFFPAQHVPVAVHARLESELGRLKGVRGEGGGLPESIPYLSVLEPLLRTLPADLRFRILELKIENGQLYLDGQVRTHSDADRIAEALRVAGFEVPPPNTNRFENTGVEFRMTAHLTASDTQKSSRKTK
jgi:type II secretory pathway component PulL